MPISTKEFVDSLVESGLMTLEEVKAVQQSLPADEQAQDLMTLARELVKRRKLTKYQAGRIYQGRSKGLVVGNYVLLDKIGEGGMGEVFKAEHRRMKRIVAIKMLPPSLVDSEKAIKRFQREVEAGAKLVHPNIVTAFDADEHNGAHYLVMEYVDGQNLAAVVAKQGPLSVEKAIACIKQAAQGLAFAHSKGIIHRDIKPHNLLIDKAGVVKILDMGLVRFDATHDGESIVRTKLTYQDQIVGTVDYMSPEQAENTSNVDQRSDVYSLGCTLYRLLTGRPPYDGESTIQKLLAHREFAVPKLRDKRDDVPPELERIYQKMVAKNPDDRYQSMEEVIAALEGKPDAEEEFDLAQPVMAARAHDPGETTAGKAGLAVATPTTVTSKAKTEKEVTVREQGERDTKREGKREAKRESRRQPASVLPKRRKSNPAAMLVLVGATAVVLIFGLLAGIVIWWFNRPPVIIIIWPHDQRKDVRLELDGRRKKLGADERIVLQVSPGKHKIYAARRGYLPIEDEVQLGAGDQYQLELNWKSTDTLLPKEGGAIIPEIGPTREQNETILKPAFLKLQAERADERAKFAAKQRAQAERIAGLPSVLDELSRARIDRYELVRAGAGVAANAPRQLVAVLGDSHLRHSTLVRQVAFDRDSQLLAAAGHDQIVRVWGATTGEELQVLKGHEADVYCVAFSPTENLLASGGLDGTIRLWNPLTGKERPPLRKAEMRVRAIAFSPDGKYLVAAVEEKLVRVWQVDTGQELDPFVGHEGKVLGVAMSYDGQLVASCAEEGHVKVWNFATRTEAVKVAGHTRNAQAVAFVPNTKLHYFVTGGDDAVAIAWDADTGAEKKRFDWDGVQVSSLAISPDGQTLATGSVHGRLRLWNLATGNKQFDQDRAAHGIAFSPNGQWLAYCGNPPQAISVHDLAPTKKYEERFVRTGHSTTVTGIAFSPDGRQLASAGQDYTLRLWDLSKPKNEQVLLGHTNSVVDVLYHPSGNTLFSGSADLSLREWAVATGKERQTLTRQGDLLERVTALALSPDGKTLACASADLSVRLWSLETGTQRLTLWGHTDVCAALAFSPDGRFLATAGHDKTVRLFDLNTGKHALVFYGHDNKVTCVAFSPDGTVLASGGLDSQIKVWDLVNLKEPATLAGHSSGVLAIAFSPDGRSLISSGLVTGDNSGDLKLWTVDTRIVREHILTATGSIVKVAFSPEGRHVATANSDGTIHILRVVEGK